MSDEMKQFCAKNGPFRVLPTVSRDSRITQFMVRDRVGGDAPLCDDEDAAAAIAEALNEAGKSWQAEN